MNNMMYYGGVNLKRFLEASGREPTSEHLAVALMLRSLEEGKSLEEIIQIITEARDYDPKSNKLDQDVLIRQLMGY